MKDASKKILVLPGSAAQVPLIGKIRELGHEAYVVNPYADSPGFAVADGHLQANILDGEACFAYASRLGVDAVVSDQCDIATGPVASLAGRLGLPAVSPESVRLFRDKSAMRDFCVRLGLPSPEHRLCGTLDEAMAFFRGLGRKMIMKPLDSNSSRGVFTISCEGDLAARFGESIGFSLAQKAVLCERFVDGTEFTIDGIKAPGQPHRCLAISEKRHFRHNPNIASSLYFSRCNPNFDYAALEAVNNRYVDESGLEFGLTHAEYKYEAGAFHLIEIGARGGGNYISSHIVPCVSGVDSLRLLVRMSLGERVAPEEVPPRPQLAERCAVLRFFDFAPGVAERIDGVDFLEGDGRVLDFRFAFAPGDRIERPANDALRVGYYIAYGETREELDSLMDEIDRRVRVVYKQRGS